MSYTEETPDEVIRIAKTHASTVGQTIGLIACAITLVFVLADIQRVPEFFEWGFVVSVGLAAGSLAYLVVYVSKGVMVTNLVSHIMFEGKLQEVTVTPEASKALSGFTKMKDGTYIKTPLPEERAKPDTSHTPAPDLPRGTAVMQNK